MSRRIRGTAPAPRRISGRLVRGLIILLALVVAGVAIVLATARPRNDRTWVPEHARMPFATFDGQLVHIQNVRDFHYADRDRFVARLRIVLTISIGWPRCGLSSSLSVPPGAGLRTVS